MMQRFAGIIFLVILSGTAFGQSVETPSATFEIADVHVSAHRQFPFMSGGTLNGDRFIIRDATMVDLIAAAYGVEDNNVLGGPSWLETDRFDVIAKAAPNTPPDTIKMMLQALLADRFRLVVHKDSKPV